MILMMESTTRSQSNHHASEDDETRYRVGFLYSVFLLAGVVAGGMGFVRWRLSTLMGLIDFGFAGLAFALLFSLRRHKQYIEIFSTVALTLSFILFFAIYLLAPYNTMRLSLFFLLTASGFFLKGRQIGRLLLVGIILAIVSSHVSGYFATGYSTLDIATTCIYLIALLFIFENYESFKEKERQRKHSEYEALRAKEAAEAANLAKSRFLATMSHEIRTPLNGVLGMAQLLLEPELSTDERQAFARTILTSGQTLLTLLNDILDLSKVEAGKLDLVFVACNPQQIIEEANALFAELARSKNVKIESVWHGPPSGRYRTDPTRLRQMLSNLVGNAIKFTERGSVRVDANEVERNAGQAVIEFAVMDSGIGIPPDKLSLLFTPFSQMDSSDTRQYGGTGLGLSIVRSLAELMNGNAGGESEPGKGSRFWFRIRADILPDDEKANRIEPGARVNATDETAVPSAGHVLVVEDDSLNRMVVKAMLGKLGIRSEIVENGQEAIDAVTRGMRPDAVLMDCQMPVMDGFTATQRIRRWEAEARQTRVPIIALTAGVFEDDRQRCITAGMDDFLSKPINVHDLAVILAKWAGVKVPQQKTT